MKALLQQFIAARQTRLELQKVVDQLKQREEDIKRTMILKMQADGVKTINIEGMGTCTRKDKTFYDITDYDRFADIMAKMIMKCQQAGQPRIEATFLQKTVCASRVDEWLERLNLTSPEQEAAFLESIGLQKCSRPEISITQAKTKGE